MSLVHPVKKCPVCDMDVTENEIALYYRGIEFRFCSEQCRLRFDRRPHLFVGDPRLGESEKQKGTVVKKAHKIKLKVLPDLATRELLAAEIGALMGIESVEVNKDEITLVYDLLQVSMEDIENVIIQAQGHLKQTMTDKLRKGLIQYSEECELDNLAHLSKDSGCH